MKKKSLKVLIATLILLIGSGTLLCSTPSQSVEAKSKIYILNHTTKYKKARILKKTAVRKIHFKNPMYKSTLGPKHYLKKNKIVYILRLGTDFGWYIKVPGHSGLWTLSGRRYMDTSWFSFNTKIPKKARY